MPITMIATSTLAFSGASTVSGANTPPNMNGNYTISTGVGTFSTAHHDYEGGVESFTLYSPPIKSRYSMVYWTMQEAVPLPADIVARFDGKVMAVTGYEADQVMVVDGVETSVPITWAYNHHFEHHLSGKNSVLERVAPGEAGGRHGGENWVSRPRRDDPNASSPIPVATMFSEGNGGEYRKSWHGYASPYAQLVESPVTWSMMPMQIDTRNRDGSMAKPGDPFVPGPVPKSAQGRAPTSGADAVYSGLLECPCTDRIGRKVVNASAPFGDTADGVLTYEGRLMPPNPPTFSRNCAPWPTGELLSQHNPTCDIRTYQGGLRCCPHEGFLLDTDQAVPDDVLEYRFKVRFYFQPHDARKHEPVWRWGFSGSPGSDEYDIECAAGTPPSECIHSIVAYVQPKDFASRSATCESTRSPWNNINPACKPGSVGFKPVHLGGHCHAPACLSMELYNDDTGELICRHVPTYGTKVAGATGDHRFDEKCLALPPCVWGSAAQGLLTRRSCCGRRAALGERANNTYAHRARWRCGRATVCSRCRRARPAAVGASPRR